MSNIFVNENDEILLSWIEFLNDTTDVLMLSHYKNEMWSEPIELQRGSDWFVNWADFPAVAQFENSTSISYHWLQKSAGGTYDYDIKVSNSNLDERSKASSSEPIKLHSDTVAAEHGFVSLVPYGNKILATWLDGRNTKDHPPAKSQSEHHHHNSGAMTIQAALFDESLNVMSETLLDVRVCDCCQTDAAVTENGPIIVYRDRTKNEVRDISFIKLIDGEWTEPKSVFNDNWKIAGCPVNGPAVSVFKNEVAVVWYSIDTIHGPNIKCAISTDDGQNFNEPFVVDNSDPLGRVDVVPYAEGQWLISYVDQLDSLAQIKLNAYNSQGDFVKSIDEILTSDARASGFPILEKFENNFILSYTDVLQDNSKVQTQIYSLN